MCRPRRICQPTPRGSVAVAVALAVLLGGVSGCADFFNPSFLQLFDGPADATTTTGFEGVQAPNGHIPILFLNKAKISDAVFRYVIQGDTVVRPEVVDELLRLNPQLTRAQVEDLLQDIIDGQPVDLEGLNNPPRVRVTVDVTPVDRGTQRLEFLEGLRLVRTESDQFGTSALPVDLQENTNDTYIVQCDIGAIQIVRVDVFVPVVLRITRNIFNRDGFIIGEECFSQLTPQFDDLEFDQGFDASQDSFNVLRNIDPRFFPPALNRQQCGVVVVIELEGELTLPFRNAPCPPSVNPPDDGRVPAVLNVDTTSQNEIPGRYSVRVSVRDQ